MVVGGGCRSFLLARPTLGQAASCWGTPNVRILALLSGCKADGFNPVLKNDGLQSRLHEPSDVPRTREKEQQRIARANLYKRCPATVQAAGIGGLFILPKVCTVRAQGEQALRLVRNVPLYRRPNLGPLQPLWQVRQAWQGALQHV